MQKHTISIFVTTLLIAWAVGPCFAQINGATDTSKEGSLLIWPKIQTSDSKETYISVTNNSPDTVCLKCFWEVKDVRASPTSQCLPADFSIQLSSYTPVFFKASDGSGLDGRSVAAGLGYSEEGALRCWAVNPSGYAQISWNHMSGLAIIVNSSNADPAIRTSPTTAWQYNAWRFAANVITSDGTFADGFWVGQVGDDYNQLNLKASPTTVVDPRYCVGPEYGNSYCFLANAAYDACPSYLNYDFLAEPSSSRTTDGFAFNNLALVTCKSDLTEPASNTKTKIEYTIWNETDVQYPYLTQCANCAFQVDLGSLGVLRTFKSFWLKNLHTPAGRFTVDAVPDETCDPESSATPTLGVMSSKLVGSTAIVGNTGSSSGKATSDYGYIRWIHAEPYMQ